jgi:hypothetical protein
MFRRIVMFIVCLFSLQGVQLQAQPVNVTIDADEVQWTISKYLLGMHLVYPHERDAIYADGRIADWARKAGVGTIRFPGGTVVEYWDWENPTGIFRGDRWDPEHNPADEVDESEWMSLDEYIVFCRRVGAEPQMGVNILGGHRFDRVEDSIARAVRCVEYCKDNGYNVKFWYLGNEIHGRLGIERYAELVRDHALAMKKVDPDILVWPNENELTDEDLKVYLEICGDAIDGIEFHGKWKGFKDVGTFDMWKQEAPLVHAQGKGIYSEKIKGFRKVASDMGYPDLLMANNEWGLGQKFEGFDKYGLSLIMVDYLQDMFIGQYDMACLWNTHWPGRPDMHLLDATDEYSLNSIGYGFELLSSAQGEQMAVSTSSNKYVYGFACRSKDGSLVQMYLLNKTEKPQPVKVTVRGIPALTGDVAGHMLQAPGKSLDMLKVQKAGANQYTATLPAYSYTRIQMHRD